MFKSRGHLDRFNAAKVRGFCGGALMWRPFSELMTVPTSKSVAASQPPAIEAIATSGAIAYWTCTTHTWALLRSLTLAFLSAHELITLEGGDR
ncbi:hypothetical protein XI09_03160 [Bradyrhizobium sp. CCBAU 11386]|uniref:hypothetical protein n=1 Tax=Bradyrhizobium sp. CCBAU 11386 TaxID=1630837 RepID=UPI002301FF98|nr:hypothetical protein [Bradyrhizobium sp. CCBAU 11386]MDA9503824.1 hypothetical protein [Bradyrhizobium sp. CCBAU 11386]